MLRAVVHRCVVTQRDRNVRDEQCHTRGSRPGNGPLSQGHLLRPQLMKQFGNAINTAGRLYEDDQVFRLWSRAFGNFQPRSRELRGGA